MLKFGKTMDQNSLAVSRTNGSGNFWGNNFATICWHPNRPPLIDFHPQDSDGVSIRVPISELREMVAEFDQRCGREK